MTSRACSRDLTSGDISNVLVNVPGYGFDKARGRQNRLGFKVMILRRMNMGQGVSLHIL